MKTLNRCKMKLYKLESAMADNSNIQWIAEHRDEWSRKFDEMAACREALDKFFALGDEDAAVAASQALLTAGFLVPAIRYPTVARGSARLRVTVTAGHDRRPIADLASRLRAARPGMPSVSGA